LWGLVAIVVVGAVVILGSLLGVAPKLDEAKAASSELTQVEQQNTAHELALATLKSEFAQIDDLKNEVVELQLGIPLTADIPAFVDQLGASAAQYGVNLDQISISDGTGYLPGEAVADTVETAADTTTETDTAAAGAVASTVVSAVAASPRLSPTTYISVPVSIEATGTNESVLQFLSALQHGQRIVAINSFSTDATDSAAVTLSVTAEIYVLVDPFAEFVE
jgi:Tfp pilus assembly protein PilO